MSAVTQEESDSDTIRDQACLRKRKRPSCGIPSSACDWAHCSGFCAPSFANSFANSVTLRLFAMAPSSLRPDNTRDKLRNPPNEDNAANDTFLQVTGFRQLHPVVRRRLLYSSDTGRSSGPSASI